MPNILEGRSASSAQGIEPDSLAITLLEARSVSEGEDWPALQRISFLRRVSRLLYSDDISSVVIRLSEDSPPNIVRDETNAAAKACWHWAELLERGALDDAAARLQVQTPAATAASLPPGVVAIVVGRDATFVEWTTALAAALSKGHFVVVVLGKEAPEPVLYFSIVLTQVRFAPPYLRVVEVSAELSVVLESDVIEGFDGVIKIGLIVPA